MIAPKFVTVEKKVTKLTPCKAFKISSTKEKYCSMPFIWKVTIKQIRLRPCHRLRN